MQRSPPHPRSRKTPRGGRRTAKMILQMSLSGLLVDCRPLTSRRRTFAYLAVKAMMTECVGYQVLGLVGLMRWC